MTYDCTTLVAGSTIDFQVMDAPLVNSEIFQTDLVSAIQLPAGSSLMAS